MLQISEGQNDNIFAFTREKDGNQVVVILNLSNQPQGFKIKGTQVSGLYENAFSNQAMNLNENLGLGLKSWGYFVFIKQ